MQEGTVIFIKPVFSGKLYVLTTLLRHKGRLTCSEIRSPWSQIAWLLRLIQILYRQAHLHIHHVLYLEGENKQRTPWISGSEGERGSNVGRLYVTEGKGNGTNHTMRDTTSHKSAGGATRLTGEFDFSKAKRNHTSRWSEIHLESRRWSCESFFCFCFFPQQSRRARRSARSAHIGTVGMSGYSYVFEEPIYTSPCLRWSTSLLLNAPCPKTFFTLKRNGSAPRPPSSARYPRFQESQTKEKQHSSLFCFFHTFTLYTCAHRQTYFLLRFTNLSRIL